MRYRIDHNFVYCPFSILYPPSSPSAADARVVNKTLIKMLDTVCAPLKTVMSLFIRTQINVCNCLRGKTKERAIFVLLTLFFFLFCCLFRSLLFFCFCFFLCLCSVVVVVVVAVDARHCFDSLFSPQCCASKLNCARPDTHKHTNTRLHIYIIWRRWMNVLWPQRWYNSVVWMCFMFL